MKLVKNNKFTVWMYVLLVLLPLSAALAALFVGRMRLSLNDVINAVAAGFTGGDRDAAYITVWSLRMPRILLSLAVGAGLSVSGCAYQSLFSNPLATPDTLGVASGASFGAATGLLLGFGMLGVQATSFLFGIAAVILSWLASAGRGRHAVVLAGIMIGSLFSALVSLVKFTADEESQLPAITYWLMGSLKSVGYKNLAWGVPPILIGITIFFLIRWRMNLLPLSDDEAAATGTNMRVLRIVTVVAATVITSSCISMCGQVGWIGLLIPHICRLCFGDDHMKLIPASVSFGAVFMVAVDTMARSITASEIPVSILTAVIGAPFFIILMRRQEVN